MNQDSRDLGSILIARQISRQAALNAIADVQRRRAKREKRPPTPAWLRRFGV